MRNDLYRDLYELEEKHWWHIAKRRICLNMIHKYLFLEKPKILDIGCGTGKNIEAFNKIGRTWGLDSSSEAIKYCRRRELKNVKLGDVASIKFDYLFDLITLLDVLEHIDRDVDTLQNIRRVLKPKGLLILTVPAYPLLWSQWDVVLHHHRRYTKASLCATLEKNGFKILKISYMYSFLLLPIFFFRLIKSRFSKNEYISDFKLGNKITNYLLQVIADLERTIIVRWGIPFGTSIICVAQKI